MVEEEEKLKERNRGFWLLQHKTSLCGWMWWRQGSREIRCLSYCAECAMRRRRTVFHIVSERRVHAQTEYKGRHDKLAKVIHWNLCKKYSVKVRSKWYDHVPEKVEETDHVKILWDFNIQTDHVIEHRQPDVVVLGKHEKMRLSYRYSCAGW